MKIVGTLAQRAFFALSLVLAGSSGVHAALALTPDPLTSGSLVGVYSGNDSESELEGILGLGTGTIMQLDKVEEPDTISGDLSLINIIYDEGEPKSGEWVYSGLDAVEYIAVKAGNQFALYEYVPGAFAGLWDTGDLGNKGMSHVTAYSVVPVPAAAWMIGTAILGGLGFARKARA